MSATTMSANETIRQSSHSLLSVPRESSSSVTMNQPTPMPTQSNPLPQMPSSSQIPQLTFTTTRYRLRCTAHELYLNDEPIPYEEQILNMDKFYIIKTHPQSQLKTPIILHRNKQLDTLDRRLFTKKFLFEIIKSLEICSFADAVFICERIPKQVKYFVNVVQGLSLIRWKMLLMNDAFFIAFYSCLEGLITKKPLMSPLRRDMLEDLLQTRLKSSHSRLFYMMDNLVLENEDLRNTITNLTRNIVMEQMSKRRFIENYILKSLPNRDSKENANCNSMVSESEDNNDDDETNSEEEEEEQEYSSEGENSGIEDNLFEQEHSASSSNKEKNKNNINNNESLISSTLSTTHPYPEHLLQTIINTIKSSLRLKLPKQFITKTLINTKLFYIIKHLFKESFERQSELLMELMCVLMEIEPNKLWEVVFGGWERNYNDKGIKREQERRNLLLLEVMVTNKVREFVTNTTNDKVNATNKPTTPALKTTTSPYQLITQLLTITISPIENEHLKQKFITTIITKSLLIFTESSTTSTYHILRNEELECILSYLELCLRDIINERYNSSVKGNSYCHDRQIMQGENDYKKCNDCCNCIKEGVKNVVRKIEKYIIGLIECKNKCINNSTGKNNKTHLPLPKPSIITLLKIYKLLIKNERLLFNNIFELNLECVDYLLSITRYRKGVIEGVRLELIDIIEKGATNDGNSSVSGVSVREGDLSVME